MNKLKKLRLEKGLTQQQVALKANCAAGTVSRIELGFLESTNFGVVRDYCAALGITTEEAWRLNQYDKGTSDKSC